MALLDTEGAFLYLHTTMTQHLRPLQKLSAEEWQEAKALLKAISDNPATVVPSKMEEFSALFVRTLAGKGNSPSIEQ